NINRPNLRTKKYILKPNPGRLIVRVPAELKNADLFINGREIGEMEGKIAKGFQVDANVSLKVQATYADLESDIKIVEVGPEETKKVEFTEFSDLRLIALRKEKEEKEVEKRRKEQERIAEQRRKEQDKIKEARENAESERRMKEQAAKMKKLFENTRVEIRTYGHLLDGAAYSLYFYFDPRFGIGYFREGYNAESNPSSTATYYDYDTTFKYRVEHAGYVIRVRYAKPESWSSPGYLVDSLGLSLF
ncbi:uncharacterized protein METZ01_LOCUS471345, partial [marine metagenome]